MPCDVQSSRAKQTVHMCGYWEFDLCYLQYQSPKNGHVVHYP